MVVGTWLWYRHLHEHVLPHGAADEGRISAMGLVVEEADVGVLGGERKSCESVHDKIHPQQLQHVEGLLADEGADEGHDERHDVDGELELQELPDVVEHGAAPEHCEHDRLEVVV